MASGMSGVRTPRSRLSDDLYRLYLAALGWVLLPTYGDGVGLALPSSASAVDAVPAVVVVIAAIGALWSGWRGGPLMVSRAAIIHELGSPGRRVDMLWPQLVRQSAGLGMGAAVVAAGVSAMGPDDSWAAALRHSLVALFSVGSAVGWATVWMVSRHGVRLGGGETDRAASASRPVWLQPVAGLAAVVSLGFALAGGEFTERTGLALLSAVALAGFAAARLALPFVPVALLWRRATALESVRAAMLNADAHRMLTNIRRAAPQPAVGRRHLQRPWMPTPLWRFVASAQHDAATSFLRVGGSVAAAVALAVAGDLRNGLVIAAFAACWLVVGIELTRSLAATADQITFVLHYPRRSSWLLAGQLVIALGLGAVLAVLAIGWQLWADRPVAISALIIAMMAVLAGAVQGRLGSPNVGRSMGRMGMEMTQALLWARAVAAPILVAVVTLVVFHQWISPDLVELPSLAGVPVLLALGATAVAIQPLEMSFR